MKFIKDLFSVKKYLYIFIPILIFASWGIFSDSESNEILSNFEKGFIAFIYSGSISFVVIDIVIFIAKNYFKSDKDA